MSVKTNLEAARKRIENPDDWYQLGRGQSFQQRCAGEAIEAVVSAADVYERDATFRALTEAIEGAAIKKDPLYSVDCVVKYNDNPTTTHSDILAMFDKAIQEAA